MSGVSDGLASLQRAVAALVSGATTEPGVDARADAIAAGGPRLTPAMQLAIYREQFVLRHVDALREDFRSLAHVLGDAAFEALAGAYFQASPSSSFTLRDLGAQLARFLAEREPWREDPLLSDLARVEWAFVEAFDAPDAPALALDALSAIAEDAWPSCRVQLAPSVQRLALAYPAHELRQAVCDARATPATVVRPAARLTYLIVFRGADGLRYLSLAPDAYALLDELAGGAALGAACERVAAASATPPDAFEERLGAWFGEWTALGWISRVEPG